MATASPTPMSQGSHFTSLGRRTSARQALRRPPSRSQMGASVAASSAAASKRSSTTAADAQQQQQQQYATLHDSSDDEMPIPMKLSALTKALLGDGVSAPEGSAAAAGGPVMTTRRRSALTRSTSSTTTPADADSSSQPPSQPDRPVVRQTRRHVRAASVQASGGPSSASRASSPPALRSRDSSPAPRKRVVRLSAATPATGMGPVPPPATRRSLSLSKHAGSGRRTTASDDRVAAASHGIDLPAASSIDAVMALPATDAVAAPFAVAAATVASAPAETINTPASAVRRVQIAVSSSGSRSASRAARLSPSSSAMRITRQSESASGHHSDDADLALAQAPLEPPATVARAPAPALAGSALRSYGSGSGSASHDMDGLPTAPPSSMRIKRVGKALGGGFLSGPARRGRLRANDEDGEGHSPDNMQPHHHGEGDLLAPGHDSEMDGARHGQDAYASSGRSPLYDTYGRDYAATGSPVGGRASSAQRVGSLRSRSSKADDLLSQQHDADLAPAPAPVVPSPERHADQGVSRRRSYAKAEDEAAPAPVTMAPPASQSSRPNLPSTHDQENDLAYLARSVKPLVIAGLGDAKDASHNNKNHMRPLRSALQSADARLQPAPVVKAVDVLLTVSPERKVLSTMSRNTPHRLAPPPPPKMSVLETATAATAGAAATAHANKKPRILLKINGRSYQRVDCVGRGGSGKVYKVTAENGKMFAMKRVSLENADESTIRGFLGEIDLLKKLSGVDRVIQLFDFEMNKDKQMLSLLMELGEMDLNSLLRVRQNPESAKLDPVFVRFYWKEMLECLQAVHAHDIVHSDLKPANFVLVQGRLKLIDFGIANAIQTEMTVNVHRETQIGTPNYMSPESLMDAQQYAFTANHGGRPGAHGLMGPKGAPKLMKLGKPSDVWSLGCILYQMVYGLPPFGHIQNQMARCQAIITWTHAIDFPARGMGGALVPPGLIATMKRCLNREQQLRPTCEELLSPMDPFLYPEAQYMTVGGGAECMPITEELLGRIIQSVVTRCRERMPTDGEAVSAWPAAYWSSVRRAVAAKEERQ